MKMKYFIEICKRKELELKKFLHEELLKYYNEEDIFDEQGFLYARQKNSLVLLTAHMDTVHKEPVQMYEITKTKDGRHCISSPQGIGGDDRCGIYIILKILAETKFRPAILFCEQEEVGGIGSELFCNTDYIEELKKLKFFIELDRANAKDLVFYSDDNTDFHNWCKEITGYEEDWGTFSDISNLCPVTEISGVNISCGYYKAHTTNEYVIWEEMLATTEKVKKMLTKTDTIEPFEYIPCKYDYSRWNYGYNEWDWNSYWKGGKYNNSTYNNKSNDYYSNMVQVYFLFEEEGVQKETYIEGYDENDCWVTLFINHPTVCFNSVLDWEVYKN